ncbi:type VI secretion system tube protein TssD [Spirosoma gilvum]
MSFKSTLTVEGKEFSVLQCYHKLGQKTDNGRPTSGVRGGLIQLILDSSDEDILGDWATGPTTKKDGEIVFERTDQQSTLTKLEFKEAYLTLYFEFVTSNYIDVNSVQVSLDELAEWDLTNEDDFNQRVVSNTKTLVHFVDRTRVSNCILLRISAGAITLDGIDHKNT